MSAFEKIKAGLEEAISYKQGRGEANESVRILLEAQEAFQGVADALGVKTEQDIVDMVKEVRAERAQKKLI